MSRSRRGTGCVYRRGAIWWVKYFRAGEPFYESSQSREKEDAERLLKQRQGEIATGRFAGLGPERVRVGELLDDVLEDYRLQKRASTKDAETRIRLHLRPEFGGIRAADLGTREITRYILKRRDEKAQDATINRELALLRRAYSLAARSEPPKVVRLLRVPRLAEDNTRTGFLEHAQYIALRDELPEYAKLIFVIAYHTGIRSGELRKVQWSQIDLSANEIRLSGRQTKNKRPRTAPIYGDMVEWLKLAKEMRDREWPNCPWVFSRRGQRLGDFRKVWAAACSRAGVPGLLFHDLRRSAVRNMERAGVPRNVAMRISGHRTEAVYRRYDIVNSRDLRTAADRMERFFKGDGRGGTKKDEET